MADTKNRIAIYCLAAVFFTAIIISSCGKKPPGPAFRPIQGFSTEVNERLKNFLLNPGQNHTRKIAVFDGDGTVLGQAPHYLADECLYRHVKANPGRKSDLIKKMIPLSNVSLAYVEGRVRYLAGEKLLFVRELGSRCFKDYYAGKIFEPMRRLISLLKDNGFEIWIVSASPEAMYQGFLSRELGIPITNIIGVKSTVKAGVLTDEIIRPVPQDEGKKQAIETFIQDQPLIVAGNSRGDKEMIEYSRGLKIIVNPDEYVAADQTESMAGYAESRGWLIVRLRDVPEPGFPSISSKDFKIRPNKINDIP
ncbi:MAG: haloacid dehalogenase-like hydrolase [Elusimicrobia bacterium]|nr:haloacid dehalogenase-like hydrolase [Elusimicrobiota bacterium]